MISGPMDKLLISTEADRLAGSPVLSAGSGWDPDRVAFHVSYDSTFSANYHLGMQADCWINTPKHWC